MCVCVCILGKFIERVPVTGNINDPLESTYSPENVERNSIANFIDLIHFTEFIQSFQVPCLLFVQFNIIVWVLIICSNTQEVTIELYNCNLPPIQAYTKVKNSKKVSSNYFFFSWVPLLQYILPNKLLLGHSKFPYTDFVNITAASGSMTMNCANIPLIQRVNPIEVIILTLILCYY